MMKKILLILGLLLLPPNLPAQVRLHFGLECDDMAGLSLRMSNMYRLPERDGYELRGIPEEEIPMILFIHARSPHSLRQIVALRRNGASWVQLSGWCGISPTAYEFGRPAGPPYGNAYGHFKHGRGRWAREQLRDEDIVRAARRAYACNPADRRDDDGRSGGRGGHGRHGRWEND